MKSFVPSPHVATRQLASTWTANGAHRPRVPFSKALFSTSQPRGEQVHPRGGYYDTLLNDPIPYADVKSEGPPSTAKVPPATSTNTPPAKTPEAEKPKKKASAATTTTTTTQEGEGKKGEEKELTLAERAKLVFGSRIVGPAERAARLAEIRNSSRMIAGVMVPQKPDEPENCCMSGCVDCVWDRYRDELEHWATASAEASRRLKAQEAGVASTVARQQPADAAIQRPPPPDEGMSMDDDGGGLESNWDEFTTGTPKLTKGWNEELYQNVPVGIREFMRQEKRIRMKHKHDQPSV